MELAESMASAERDRAIRESQRNLMPQQHPDFDGENCLRCGDPIPPKRLEMGRIRCTDCEGLLEKQRAR